MTLGAPTPPAPSPTPTPTPTPAPTPRPRTAGTLTATCDWPIIASPIDLRLGFSPRYPLYVKPDTPIASWPLPVTVAYLSPAWTLSDFVAARTLATELRVGLRIVSPDGSARRVTVRTRLSDLAIPANRPADDALQLTGTLWLPSVAFTGTGIGSISIDSVTANNEFVNADGDSVELGLPDDSDGRIGTFDIACGAIPPVRVLEVGVTPTAPNALVPPTPTPAPRPLPIGNGAPGPVVG